MKWSRREVATGLVAGVPAALLAISLSTGVLYAAKSLGIDVAGSALLQLVTRELSPLARDTGVASAWRGAGLPGQRSCRRARRRR